MLKTLMRYFVFIFVVLSFPMILTAQILKERRVYYLDCSYSMVQLDLWDKVREKLINAIENVSDETTELIVIPFACDNQGHTRSQLKDFATENGKKKLINSINNLDQPNTSTMTYHDIPLNNFEDNWSSSERVTYMFLMTDGKDDRDPPIAKMQILPKWGQKYGNKNVFGFYVVLHDSGRDPEVNKIIDQQKHIWMVETADVNINLIRLQSNAVFNAKNDKYFDLPLFGNHNGKNFKADFPSACPYKVQKIEHNSNSLRIWVDCQKNTKLPESTINQLSLKLLNGGPYEFLVTDRVSVECVFKPERSLKISVR